jgi:hypothetical protein
MKTIFLMINIFIVVTLGFSQEESNYPCDNNVSTNPLPGRASNNNLPNNQFIGFNFGDLFLNSFNWFPITQGNTLPDMYTLVNEFDHLLAGENMHHLYSHQNHPYYDYLVNEVKMPTPTSPGFYPDHQNGWELLALNLGYFPDGTPYSYHVDPDNLDGNGNPTPFFSNLHPTLPYVVLYNRYLSKIRVFANVGEQWAINNAYQAVEVSISLSSAYPSVNGLLRINNGLDQALDVNTSVLKTGAICESQNTKRKWFSADINVSYDPCVCDYSSGFSIDFQIVKNSSFILQGRSLQVQIPIVNENGKVVEDGLLTNFNLDPYGVDGASGGLVIYEKMQDLVDEYIQKYEKYKTTLTAAQQHNKKVDRNLAILKYTGQALSVAASLASGGTTAVVGSAFILALKDYAPDLVEKKNGSYVVKHEKTIAAAEKLIGEGVKHYSNSTWKKVTLPQAPMAPTAMFSEMYFKGNLTTVDTKSGPKIMTPGTYGTSNVDNIPDQHIYPIYNDALGIFALLESPELEMYENKNRETHVLLSRDIAVIENAWVAPQPGTLNFFHMKEDKVTQFKLKKDLKYVFNPTLPIKNYTIDVGYEVHSTFKKATTFPDFFWFAWEDGYANRTLPYFNVNTNSVYNNFEINEEIIEDTLDFSTVYVPIDAAKNLIYSTGYQTYWVNPGLNHPSLLEDNAYNQTQYNFFKTYLEDPAYIAEIIGQSVKTNRYFLKLIVKVEYDDVFSDGEPHEYTYVYTYEIPEERIHKNSDTPLSEYLYGSNLHINQFPEDLTLEDVNFNGSNVEGCKLNGNAYVCKAWNDVNIQGVIQVGSGYNVVVEAGREINMVPEAVVPSEMTFSISPVLDFSNPMPEATASEVGAFCLDINRYKARAGNKSLIVDSSTVALSENSIQEPKQPFSFSLFPNPTTQQTTVKVNGEYADQVSIVVYDIAGKEQRVAISGEGGRFNLDVAHLAKGLYLVKVSTFGESQTKQLVIN